MAPFRPQDPLPAVTHVLPVHDRTSRTRSTFQLLVLLVFAGPHDSSRMSYIIISAIDVQVPGVRSDQDGILDAAQGRIHDHAGPCRLVAHGVCVIPRFEQRHVADARDDRQPDGPLARPRRRREIFLGSAIDSILLPGRGQPGAQRRVAGHPRQSAEDDLKYRRQHDEKDSKQRGSGEKGAQANKNDDERCDDHEDGHEQALQDGFDMNADSEALE